MPASGTVKIVLYRVTVLTYPDGLKNYAVWITVDIQELET